MRKFFILVICLFISNNAFGLTPSTESKLKQLDNDVQQAVIVQVSASHTTQAVISAWERKEGEWVESIAEFEAVIGRNGWADINQKREGDGRTPTGIFKLRRAFGYEVSIETGLEYRPVNENDLWVDDADSPQYNEWITTPTDAKSFERLRRDDDLYKYAIVIEYNTDPIVPGNGSAIFMHIWRGADQSTAGCVAMPEEKIVSLLKWLDVHKQPVVMIGL